MIGLSDDFWGEKRFPSPQNTRVTLFKTLGGALLPGFTFFLLSSRPENPENLLSFLSLLSILLSFQKISQGQNPDNPTSFHL